MNGAEKVSVIAQLSSSHSLYVRHNTELNMVDTGFAEAWIQVGASL